MGKEGDDWMSNGKELPRMYSKAKVFHTHSWV